MLLELIIKDFVIIDSVRLTVSPGFNVLTGETGAGKSIIIDAMGALLGGRVSADLVRTGASASLIEGVFALPQKDAESWEVLQATLEEFGLASEEETLILSREIGANGRSIARINRRVVPAGVLQQVGRSLIDIHGQTEHLSLLRVARHLEFLDGFKNLSGLRREVETIVLALRKARKQIDELTRDERELARRMDLLTFQIKEIESAAPTLSEEEELAVERTLLANSERLITAVEGAHQTLYEGGEDQKAVLDLIDEVISAIASLVKLDPSLEPQMQALEQARFQVEDVAHFLRGYRDRIECDQGRLETVEERISLLHNLKRKYGATISEVMVFLNKAKTELEAVSTSEERLVALRQEERSLLKALGEKAEALSVARQSAAQELSSAVERELADLNMPNSRFAIEVTCREANDGVALSNGQIYDFDSTGIDQVEFMLSSNPGEPARPLAKIASGGEISRVMLALKTVLSRVDPVTTLIFDEIDSGIGGRTAPVIGRKLWNLSRGHQIMCVTHLPQIASFADTHVNISKKVDGGHTSTIVSMLDDTQRVDEVAAMLGGSTTAVSRENARELITIAQRWKENNGTGPD